MTLRQKQSQFAHMVALLILHAEQLGYSVTFGDCYRDERCAYGSSKSFHKKRLAVDLNLFRNGYYLRSTEAHRPFGEFWKSIGGSWGGDFLINYGYHYSFGVV